MKSPDKRRSFLKHWYKYFSNNRPIVYIDETGFDSTTQRDYGRNKRGSKVFDYQKGTRSIRTSLVAGYLDKKCIAPMLFSGSCNSEVFNTWFEEQLIPELPGNSVVVLDNATFHKSDYLKEISLKHHITLLFLPPYSPDLNPIEKLWANLKRFWRNHSTLNLDQMILQSGFI